MKSEKGERFFAEDSIAADCEHMACTESFKQISWAGKHLSSS